MFKTTRAGSRNPLPIIAATLTFLLLFGGALMSPAQGVLAAGPSPSPSATPGPSDTPGPSASLDPSPTPDVSPPPGPTGTPGVEPTPGPSGTPGPTGTPGVEPTPGPSDTPGPTGTPGVEPTPGPSGTPGPTPTPGPTATPAPTPNPNPSPDAASGGCCVVTTDSGPEGSATVDDPVETSVYWPSGTSTGTTSISEIPNAGSPPAGYAFLGMQVNISTPPGTAADPITLVFSLDASLIPVGQDPSTIVVFRNGVPLVPCNNPSVVAAAPDPCIATSYIDGYGDLLFSIFTSHASTWNFGVVASASYGFNGFTGSVDNSPTVNRAQPGSAVSLAFSLNPGLGTNIFTPGFPASRSVDCLTGAPLGTYESAATAASSMLTYNARTGRYQYVWKTKAAWAGSCREFSLGLRDGSVAVAWFKFRP